MIDPPWKRRLLFAVALILSAASGFFIAMAVHAATKGVMF